MAASNYWFMGIAKDYGGLIQELGNAGTKQSVCASDKPIIG